MPPIFPLLLAALAVVAAVALVVVMRRADPSEVTRLVERRRAQLKVPDEAVATLAEGLRGREVPADDGLRVDALARARAACGEVLAGQAAVEARLAEVEAALAAEKLDKAGVERLRARILEDAVDPDAGAARAAGMPAPAGASDRRLHEVAARATEAWQQALLLDDLLDKGDPAAATAALVEATLEDARKALAGGGSAKNREKLQAARDAAAGQLEAGALLEAFLAVPELRRLSASVSTAVSTAQADERKKRKQAQAAVKARDDLAYKAYAMKHEEVWRWYDPNNP